MLEQLACDDDVERVVLERHSFLDVGPDRLDPETRGCLLERRAVDVDADDVVALGVVLRQRTRPAAQVEHTPPGTADEGGDHVRALVAAEDELLPAAVAVVGLIAAIEAVEPGHAADHRYGPRLRRRAGRVCAGPE